MNLNLMSDTCIFNVTHSGFMQLFYVDRLNRNPLDWNIHPRIKVWSTEELDKAEKEDELQSSDFGKLGVSDLH